MGPVVRECYVTRLANIREMPSLSMSVESLLSIELYIARLTVNMMICPVFIEYLL